jgi:hypothetical protein
MDYVGTSGTLLFTNGVTNLTFKVTIINQAGVQPAKTVLLSLTNPTNALPVAPTNATLTIYDTAVGISFASTTNSAVETSGSVAVNVVRTGNLTGSVTVNYATTNGTALAGVNYTATSGMLTFGDGQSLQTIYIPLLYDTNLTGPLTFTVGLSNPGSGALLLAPATTTVVVLDANAGLSFTSPAMSVLNSAGSALITVVCSNPGAEPVIVNSNTVPLSVNYSTSDGTGVAGQDYLPVSGTLVFINGIATNTFTVPIINNGSVTSNRTFNVTLSNPTAPGVVTPYGTQTVTIIDINSGLLFSSPAYTVLKTNVAATINVFRTGYTDSVVSVNYIATNGTAVPGLNFVPTAGSLTFTNGITNQSFTVTVLNNGVVQPDVTVLLQLLSPANAILLPPSAATLTIHDNTGSYVIPAGSTLIYESGPTNGIIDPNETVTLLFAFRDAGGTNVTDLKATLLSTNGITAPAPLTQDYGPLVYHGHSVSRPFTFTAHGTNGQQIVATFLLTNNTANVGIGMGVFGYTLGTWVATYANTAPIYIPYIGAPGGYGPASPYPSVIHVSGLSGTVVKTALTWTNVSHTSPEDIDALLVAPNQADTLFMAHAGSQNPITHVTLSFDDAATNSLPQSGQITNGVYKPTSYLPVPGFP